ncbi:MAG TPA: hypothetical protein VEH06_07495 [Candidatus Bathyarchaeia archaeon]|nr:hypothetical protein [Candidatus Bathyarchaeia archaeon]
MIIGGEHAAGFTSSSIFFGGTSVVVAVSEMYVLTSGRAWDLSASGTNPPLVQLKFRKEMCLK